MCLNTTLHSRFCCQVFCDIENIHEMRSSLDRLRALCESRDDDKFFMLLQQTR